jgi:hypothetical protein
LARSTHGPARAEVIRITTGAEGEGEEYLAPRLDKGRLTRGVDGLLSKAKCANFVLAALQKAFLGENEVTDRSQLPTFERNEYDGLSPTAVTNALDRASFKEGGEAPITKEGEITYTRVAHADYRYYERSVVTFYQPFFQRSAKSQYQITLHEGMHLIWQLGDINFAKAVGVYCPGMSGMADSAAWDAKLQEECK